MRSRLAIAFVSVAATATIVGGVAYATIPDSTTGIITGCYKTGGTNPGALRVIDAQGGAVCLGTETQISWDGKQLTFRGAYSSVTAYNKNDVRLHQDGGQRFVRPVVERFDLRQHRADM